MPLITHGGRVESAACRLLRSEKSDQVVDVPEVKALLKLDVEDAFLEYEGARDGCRPYLILMGRPMSVQGEFPFNISEMHYDDPSDKALLAYRYDFTRRNLADLAMKGLYEPGFEPPEIIRNNVFELPCTVACAAIGPVSDDDVPVIFASLNHSSLACTDDTSGYEISEYFEAMPVREAEPPYEAERASHKALYEKAREDTMAVIEAEAPEAGTLVLPQEPEGGREAGPAEGVQVPEPVEAGRDITTFGGGDAGRAGSEERPEPARKPVQRNAFENVTFEGESEEDEGEYLKCD